MHFPVHSLVGIPVRTVSGHALGRLGDITVDADTGRLSFLEVRAPGLLKGLMNDLLHVSWAQVVSLDATQAVVADAVIAVASAERKDLGLSAPVLSSKTRLS